MEKSSPISILANWKSFGRKFRRENKGFLDLSGIPVAFGIGKEEILATAVEFAKMGRSQNEMKPIRFSKHALGCTVKRGFTEAEVEEAIHTGK